MVSSRFYRFQGRTHLRRRTVPEDENRAIRQTRWQIISFACACHICTSIIELKSFACAFEKMPFHSQGDAMHRVLWLTVVLVVLLQSSSPAHGGDKPAAAGLVVIDA